MIESALYLRIRKYSCVVLRIAMLLLVLLMMYVVWQNQYSYDLAFPNGDVDSVGSSHLIYRVSPLIIVLSVFSLLRSRIKNVETKDTLSRIRRNKAKKYFWMVKLALWVLALIHLLPLTVSDLIEMPHYQQEYPDGYYWWTRSPRLVVGDYGHTIVIAYLLEFLYDCWGDLKREWTSDQPVIAKIMQSFKVFLFSGIANASTMRAKLLYAINYAFVLFNFVYVFIKEGYVYAEIYYHGDVIPLAWLGDVLLNIPFNCFWGFSILKLIEYAFVENDTVAAS